MTTKCNQSRPFATSLTNSNRQWSASGGIIKKTLPNDFLRHLPNQIIKDKEELYFENINQKKIIHELQSKLQKISTKTTFFEQKICKTENDANQPLKTQGSDYQISPNSQQYQSTNLTIITMKRKLQEQEKQIEQMTLQIANGKKSEKSTKIKELEIDVQQFRLHNQKLKARGDELAKYVKHLEKRMLKTEDMSEIEKDNIILSRLTNKLKTQNISLNQSNQELIVNNKNLQSKQRVQENTIKAFEQKYNQLRIYQAQANNQTIFENQIVKLQQNLQEKNNVIDKTNEIIDSKNAYIAIIEKKLKDSMQGYQELNEKFMQESKEKYNLQQTLFQYKQLLSQMEQQNAKSSQMKHFLYSNPIIDLEKENNEGNVIGNQQQIKFQKVQNVNDQLIERVDTIQINKIIQNLRFQLIQQKIPCLQAEKILFDDNQQGKDVISIQELQDIFEESPFNLESEQSLLLSRYLVEDNGEQQLVLNKYNNQEIVICRSIFKRLIGVLIIQQDGEIKQSREQLRKKLEKCKNVILEQLNNEFCSLNVLYGLVNNQKMELDENMKMTLGLIAYGQNKDLDKVNVRQLFEQL